MNDVDVWHVELDVPAVHAADADAAAERWLDAREKTRADRFRFAHDRRRYVAAHVATRAILARYVEADPALLQFAVGRHGKPALVAATAPLQFNVSHSAGHGVVAVSRHSPVGVDLEQVRPHALDAGVARRFAECETAALAATPAFGRAERFTTLWARKEALAKAIGGSLATFLRVPVGDDAATTDGAVVSVAGAAAEHDLHRVRDVVPPVPRFRMAVALSGAASYDIQPFTFDWAAATERNAQW